MRAADAAARQPFFLILGAPKCGTTALAEAVAAHPDVRLSRPKEPHFFDRHYDRGVDAYLSDHFAGRPAARAAGEATPSYLALPWVPRRVAESMPQARLVAILRHPAERAFSSWWMFHARGMDRLTFEDAIAENEKRLAHSPLADDEASRREWTLHVDAIARGDPLRIRTYLDSGHYARQLRRYLALFPREQLLVLFSDDLRGGGAATMHRVWRHIGVAEVGQACTVEASNEALGDGAAVPLRLARAAGLMRLRRFLPERLRAGVKRSLSARGKRPSMEPETRARLVEHFAPHVRELEELLAVDLDSWKR